MNVTYRLKIDVPGHTPVETYQERVEDLRGIGYPELATDLSTITLDLIVEGQDCFDLGRKFAEMVVEVEGLLVPYGWELPDPDTWETVGAQRYTVRWIAMHSEPYEGMDTGGYGFVDREATEMVLDDAIPTFATYDEAVAWAKQQGWISPQGRRDDAEILAVRV